MNNDITAGYLEDMQATSVVALFETDKSQRSSFVLGILDALDKGRIDPLKVHKQVKSMEQIISMLTDKKDFPTTANAYNKYVLDAAEKQGGKTFGIYGAQWTIKEAGTKYDFTKTNDAEWARLDAEMFELKAKLKKREDFLKMLPTEGLDVLDSSTGETYKIYPPAKSSTTTISVSLK